jgi:hypothetical protein
MSGPTVSGSAINDHPREGAAMNAQTKPTAVMEQDARAIFQAAVAAADPEKAFPASAAAPASG